MLLRIVRFARAVTLLVGTSETLDASVRSPGGHLSIRVVTLHRGMMEHMSAQQFDTLIRHHNVIPLHPVIRQVMRID